MSSPPNKTVDVADIRHTKPTVPEPDEKARLEMACLRPSVSYTAGRIGCNWEVFRV